MLLLINILRSAATAAVVSSAAQIPLCPWRVGMEVYARSSKKTDGLYYPSRIVKVDQKRRAASRAYKEEKAAAAADAEAQAEAEAAGAGEGVEESGALQSAARGKRKQGKETGGGGKGKGKGKMTMPTKTTTKKKKKTKAVSDGWIRVHYHGFKKAADEWLVNQQSFFYSSSIQPQQYCILCLLFSFYI